MLEIQRKKLVFTFLLRYTVVVYTKQSNTSFLIMNCSYNIEKEHELYSLFKTFPFEHCSSSITFILNFLSWTDTKTRYKGLCFQGPERGRKIFYW